MTNVMDRPRPRNLPWLFKKVHGRDLLAGHRNYGDVFRVILKEPLGAVPAYPSATDATFHFVTIRCVKYGDEVHMEALTPDDFKLIVEWCRKHRDTPIGEFTRSPLSWLKEATNG